jgi:hypothetical protein
VLFSSYDWLKILLLQFATEKYVSVLLVFPTVVSITFCSVYSKNKKVFGHASTGRMDVRSLGLVMEFRLHTNVTDFPLYNINGK